MIVTAQHDVWTGSSVLVHLAIPFSSPISPTSPCRQHRQHLKETDQGLQGQVDLNLEHSHLEVNVRTTRSQKGSSMQPSKLTQALPDQRHLLGMT
jgi:hypothetical protein